MSKTSIMVQSVLYNNKPQDLLRAAENIANAADLYRKDKGDDLEVSILYGDASKNRIFEQDEIRNMNTKYEGSISFDYLFFDENTGHGKGQNLLAERHNHDYILILNPDIVVNPRLFLQLLEVLDQDKNTAIAEARQVPMEHPKAYNPKTGLTEWATGACFLIPGRIFREVGGFDWESFFMYGDDVDFSWRVRMAGYNIKYVPGAAVFHAKTINADGSWILAPAEEYYSAEAALMLAYKWGNNELLEKLLLSYAKNENPTLQKAAAAYYSKVKQKKLPKVISGPGSPAKFTDQGYGFYRFLM